jgi:hypothetical protein
MDIRHEDGRPAARSPEASRASRRITVVAGPVVIVASVLVVLNGFWLEPKLSNNQVDLLAFWMPRWCFLGEALASGHLPTWLPNQFGGVPFASDPQSGWLYVPAMALFSATSCARALGLMIVLQPLLAGLGMYWFLRNDGTGRPAATVGGLTLSLLIAGSSIALSLPFSGTLGWTAMGLAGVAGAVRGSITLRRLGWSALAVFSWSQIAGAHLSHGLLLGTLAMVLYLVMRSIVLVRAGERRPWTAAWQGAALMASMPVLGAAVLIPRVAILPRTSIGHGYRELGELAGALAGKPVAPPFAYSGVGVWWGTSFARGPGGYAGVLAIVLIAFAFSSRRWRAPASTFALMGLMGYALNVDVVVRTKWIRELAMNVGVGEVWLRSPFRFRYLVVLALGALAGYGVQAWLDAAPATRWRTVLTRLAWLVPCIVVFGALPIWAGSDERLYVLFGLGLLWTVPLLALAARGVRWPAYLLTAGVAVELVASALLGQASIEQLKANERTETSTGPGLSYSFARFRRPNIEPSAYLTPGPIGRTLMEERPTGGRYLTFVPAYSLSRVRGFLSRQTFRDWPAYENGRSILFGIDEIQGYSPVQLDPYWRLVRRVNPEPIYYNSASFQELEPSLLRLFAVEWVIGRDQFVPPPGFVPVATEEPWWTLYRLPLRDPRASVVPMWLEMSHAAALDAIVDPDFQPTIRAVLETDALGPSPRGGVAQAAPAVYEERLPERVVVRATAQGSAVVVIRNAYDENWHATLDGRPVDLLRVDYMMQGVPVGPGDHVIELFYRDPAIGWGLLASVAGWLLAGGGLLWVWRRGRRPVEAAGERDHETGARESVDTAAPRDPKGRWRRAAGVGQPDGGPVAFWRR